ncbi:MAG: hypothetical protein EOM05_10410 [Clostridia bacterium]|nr:hypothetical protein [Clostridia bacterium]
MFGDIVRWFFKTEKSVVKSGEEVLISLGFLNILAAFLGVIYFLNPYIIVKTVEKKYGKKN